MVIRQSREVLWGALRRHWRVALGAIFITAAGLVPFLIIYGPAIREVGAWPYNMALRYIPEARSYLLMADGNLIWSHMPGAILHAPGNDLIGGDALASVWSP